MSNPKLLKFLKLALITFVIYITLYIVVFVLLDDEKVNFLRFLTQGIILALIIPLFSKKLSLFSGESVPESPILFNKFKIAGLIIISLFILISLLVAIFYLVTKII